MENIHQQSKSLQKLTERNIKQIILQLYHGHWHHNSQVTVLCEVQKESDVYI